MAAWRGASRPAEAVLWRRRSCARHVEAARDSWRRGRTGGGGETTARAVALCFQWAEEEEAVGGLICNFAKTQGSNCKTKYSADLGLK